MVRFTIRITSIVFGFFFFSLAAWADTTCQVSVLSRYIGGTGDILDDRPVMQWFCDFPLGNSFYINSWVSQSFVSPGISKRLGNEFDLTLGWSGKISDSVSINPYLGYYDRASPKLFSGTNGDILSPSFRINYTATSDLTSYLLIEHMRGLGWELQGNILSIGMRYTNLPVAIDIRIIHNDHLGRSGNLWRLTLEPRSSTLVLGNLKLSPEFTFRKPLGSYGEERDGVSGRKTTIVFGINARW